MKKAFLLLMVACATFVTSCSSDDDNNTVDDTNSNTSRDIKYEVTGNYTGVLTVAFITQTGASTTDQITALPWTRLFNADAGTLSSGFGVTGSGGAAGQTITATIYQGGVDKGSVTATANAEGIITATPPSVSFQ
jgi:hypothetical protein